MQTEVTIRSSNEKLKSTDIYRQRLMVEPGGGTGGRADRFTCARLSVQRGDGPKVTIPALKGFSYEVNKDYWTSKRLTSRDSSTASLRARSKD